MKAKVLIVMGSDSDLPIMANTGKMLEEFSIPYKMTVSSAHGKAGAKNAAIFAAQILGLRSAAIKKMLNNYRRKMAGEVAKKAKKIEKG
jgi:phosphoribosylcarboxyaminoimidazole (NCAIR) mutase